MLSFTLTVEGMVYQVEVSGQNMNLTNYVHRFSDLWLSMLSLESRHLMKKTKNSENRLHTMSMEQRSLGFSH
jgi:hypothetical protein